MQFIPDIDLILGGSEEKQRAGRDYLERNSRALAEWRAHEWMLTSAASDQYFAAEQAAEEFTAAGESVLPDCLAKHNVDREAMGMPPASLAEFRQLVKQMIIHHELLKMFATGTLQ
jgi:hypothetical protein